MRKLVSVLIALGLVSSLVVAQSAQAVPRVSASAVTNATSDVDPDQVLRDLERELDREIDAPATPSSRAPWRQIEARGEFSPRRIKWVRCTDQPTMQCAVFPVPKNWNKPRKGVKNTVYLALRRMPATSRAKRPTLFVNPGGPGSSGTDVIVSFAQEFKKLTSRYNIVGWDPRGVPNSFPVPRDCATMPETTLPATGPFNWSKTFASRYNLTKRQLASCVRANKGPAKWVGTKNVARDLDAMRKAVGDKKLSYLGYSYGTTIGRTYQLMYPNRVRVMILDGTTNPSGKQINEAQNGMYGASRGWRMMYNMLPAGIRSVYQQTSSYLQNNTISGSNGSTLTRFGYWSALINKARNPVSLKSLPVLICGVGDEINITNPACAPFTPSASGKSLMFSLADREAAVEKSSPILQLVNCSDAGTLLTAKGAGSWVNRTAKYGGPEAASDLVSYLAVCSGLKKGWDSLPSLTKRTKVPTPPLIVNGVGDIATFYAGARQTHQRFAGSRLVTVDTVNHGLSIVRGNTCVDKVALAYLRTTKLPKRNVKCGKFPANPFGL